MRRCSRARAALAASACLLVAACGTGEPPLPQSDERTSITQEGTVARIAITVDGQRFQATLADSATARDLLDQLPVTIRMRDHGGVEKTGALPAPLSTDGQPDGADPDVGDVGYYAPGSDLVLYYGDQSYNDGIVILGKLEGQAAERIGERSGAITATVARPDG